MSGSPIRLRGARTHNLRGVSLDLAPGELVAITGPSGAGKSSLALDTLYAEGQRRFVESFSPYARQFLERLERPPMDSLDPVAAAIAVDRRAPAKSSRSTLATMTDLEPYLAALFAKEAIPRCPSCDRDAVPTSATDAAKRIAGELDGKPAIVTYPARAETTEGFLELREALVKDGWRRVFIQGDVRDLDEVRPSDALSSSHGEIGIVIDRVKIGATQLRRLQHAVESAWMRGSGRADVRVDGRSHAIVRGLACPGCGRSFEPPRAGLFSYNSPLGACESCRGFGRTISVDWDKVIPDHGRSIAQGAIRAWSGKSAQWERKVLVKFCERTKIPMHIPWRDLSEVQRALVIDGEGTWKGGKYPGVRAWFKWLETRTYKMHVRVFLARYREYVPCADCNGARLGKSSLRYRVGGKHLGEWHAMTVSAALEGVRAVLPQDGQGKLVRAELDSRLAYLESVGLGYLTLDRQARTLSGGEAQRAQLTTALGTSLTGALFVLDEPTVGLHALDVPRVSSALRKLADAGNTALVIEHDPSVVRACDRVIELGPGAGADGGKVLFDGSPRDLAKRVDLPTGAAWKQASRTATRERRKPFAELELGGVRENNLRNIDVRIPLGVICAITGPSGSGKSTLVHDVLYKAVARKLGDPRHGRPGAHDSLAGADVLDGATMVDQSPLGRTARGNPATYTKAWDRIRARFSDEPAAMRAGLTPAHFSFNVAKGRCDACSGEGWETVEMQFLADVSLVCVACRGRRFKPEVLAIAHRGKSVGDALAMSIDEALAIFGEDDHVLVRALEPVQRVGLGYLSLGQPLSTLSGGEAQRLKLARALAQLPYGRARDRSLLVLDEPSAGLHARDAAFVIDAMHQLADKGTSVVVVEHDLDVIRHADWIIDLGPGGGPDGGTIVAAGTPEQIARTNSKTAEALRAEQEPSKRAPGRSSVDRRPSTVDAISVEGAREHNLTNVSIAIPSGKLVVVTGPSGSGKSSLAFDVVFAEGQRRFMETLTPYARQFLPTLPRPDVDRVTGVPPSIALEQRTTRGGSTSTVATVTEVAHYLRLLYAKVGELHCPKCDAPVQSSSPDALYQRLVRTKDGTRKTVYAPAVRARKGTYLDLFTAATRAGVTTARVDGKLVAIDPPPRLAKSREHSIDLIVHFGPLRELPRDVFDRAIGWGGGAIRISDGPPTTVEWRETIHSTARACSKCGTGVPEIDPRWFSFATKQGQCAECEGAGCKACGFSKLSPVPRGVRLFDVRYHELCARDVETVLATVRSWSFEGEAETIAKAPLAELVRRLEFADRVGLGYLALDRPATTLSGGEMQRLRLSAQLGAGLTGALYVLDEPTIGLHPRDTHRLLDNLRALVDTGSTVLVVEHDEETIRAADHVIDLGPGGGRFGGRIVAQGDAESVLSSPDGPTSQALSAPRGGERNPLPIGTSEIALRGAREHNLDDVTLRIPAGRMTVVCGVSGSGKSTLVRHVFHPALRRDLGLAIDDEPGDHHSIRVPESIKRALAVDQSPIGRTPRSVPATFLGVWDEIRKLFAALPEARARGWTPARFSFNTPKGGRCTACEGQGSIVAEMSFLPDVVTPCDACSGARFEPSTLDVKWSGLSAGDVLRLSAEDAAQLFAAHPRIARPLGTLADLGVGYLQLGQGSHTLSGGEAQRLKLAAELTAITHHEPTVYVLDEPTTGLHLADVRKLVTVLDRLVQRGDTLVIVEHHPDVIAAADWIVELGPEGGTNGGQIVFEGTPAQLARTKTATGLVMRERVVLSPISARKKKVEISREPRAKRVV